MTSLHAARRELSALPQGWSVCRATPALQGEVIIPPQEGWLPIDSVSTVAHALRSSGAWSLDASPQDFDADVWWFRLNFDCPESADTPADTHASPWLIFEGLATLCDCWLNGTPLLRSRNMFRRYECALPDGLRIQGNVLLLRFDSLHSALQQKRPRPRWRTPMVAHQQLRWFRTTLLGRTPGWSPPAAAVGPWRPTFLEYRLPRQLRRSQLEASVQAGQGTLRVDCWFDGPPPVDSKPQVQIDGCGICTQAALEKVDDCGHFAAHLAIPDVQLWWPHTHGEPALYAVSLLPSGARADSPRTALGRVGFRAVELDQSHGRFALKVNQERIFCRGACWMPLDVVRLGASPQHYRRAITQARDAGMNMLRLVGATVYECSDFFDLCDELGIMVWHDLMFANMDYPAHDAGFLEDVAAEVTQQLQSLAHHPSVVVLCGNSELEQQAAMWGADREAWAPPLFHDPIAQQARAILTQAVYWPSSAHGGDFPHQPQAGTCSYYGVGAYKRPLDDAVRSGVSFATECLAFANIPGVDALRRSPAGEAPQVHSAAWKSRVYRDQLVGWDFDDVREHYVEHLLGVRPDALRAYDPAQHLRLGRAVSAEVMSRTMATWRAHDSVCGGALVWFLRDLWAGAGCGLVDELGTPKSVLHALARVQQPVLATILDRGLNGLFLHLVNETAQPLCGQVELVLYRDGETVLTRHAKALDLAPRSSGQWALTDWLDGFMDVNWAYRFGPPSTHLAVATWTDAAGTQLAQALHFEPSQMLVFNGEIGLVAHATKQADGSIMVTLQTQATAYGVHFDAFGWEPADDYFHMAPGTRKQIAFTSTGVSHGRWNASVATLNARRICHIPLLEASA